MKEVKKYISSTGQEFSTLEDCFKFELEKIIENSESSKDFEDKFNVLLEEYLSVKNKKIVDKNFSSVIEIESKPTIKPTTPWTDPYNPKPYIYFSGNTTNLDIGPSSSEVVSLEDNNE